MESIINSVNFLSNLKSKEIPLISLPNTNKTNYPKYRAELIQELKDLSYNELIVNYEEVFYLSVAYLDTILIKNNNITLSNKSIRESFTISCLSLAIKMIGRVKRNIFNMVPFSNHKLREYEGYCLQLLNYNLVYTTPFEYIKVLFDSHIKLFDLAKNILAVFVLNSQYLKYPYFTIAMGIINQSLNTIQQPQKDLLKYNKWIYSSDAEGMKVILKDIEIKKKRCFHCKFLSEINTNKRPEINNNFNLTSRNHPSQGDITQPKVERIIGTSQNKVMINANQDRMNNNNNKNIKNNRLLLDRKKRIDYAALSTYNTENNLLKFDLKKIPTVNYCKLSYLSNQRVLLKGIKQ